MSSMPLQLIQRDPTRVQFTIPGEPVAKARARSVALMKDGKPVLGPGGRPIMVKYTPEKTVVYENLVRLAAERAMAGAPPREGALRLTVGAVFTIPASWSKKRQTEAVNGPVTKRPDLDNVVKAIKDGSNGVLWRDDCQVAALIACKTFGEIPGVWVCVEDFSE